MVKILQMLAPLNSEGARSGIKRTGMRGVTIHQTGNPAVGAGAMNHAKYLQGGGASTQASWHYCVDDTQATRSIPEDEVSWNAGDGYGDGNYKTISIEMCINADGDMAKACDNAAELAADLLKRYGLGVDCLFQHHDWSGKSCPAQMRSGVPYDWNTFKNKVAAHLGATPSPTPQPNPEPTTKYKVGTAVCTNTLATASTGGKIYNGNWEGTITEVIPGRPYPYLLNNGTGWTNDVGIDTDPHFPGKPASKKSNETIAREVIDGKWGNNPERRNRLAAAGYDYNAIQSIVNNLLA